ncbi:unnamed protein product, partial [Mesorhabditis belari]|uniref:MARVEL domain-containing protein n=1 Tax=Mesorhabditis belari TaxID=2138241 RepID=A0AAF3JAV4_9BILA
MVTLNTSYLSQNRGIIKILQIIAGFAISILFCGGWTKSGCFGWGQIGYATTLNSIVTIINIVLFFLNFLDAKFWRLERVYSIICCILFLIAAALMVWFLIVEQHDYRAPSVIGTILLFFQFILYLWDVKILQGEAWN